ncbi:uncharacterized protein A1O9_06023 [Exophiala aquamarina CBS 119918]|uniref:Uncharacterized protein n=1 Tax=Exophiala aquamarina CBS 119918 TaxID=1182545 RepID=A0A072PRD8_9EURO|nr:uncharacterized protein A1O9_06023 [Exophiala aquamarina CBS 119918]KEF58100.1 hypothetical protein A1O9_06023 [Exophiala aquamarina CBS 119918]
MDDDIQAIQPEVESWYGAELRHLRSANEQVAFYSADSYIFNDGVIPSDASQDIVLYDGKHERGLLMPKQIHTSLDPFVALPMGVPEHQRVRVQFYTQTLGAGIFGVSESPRYSPTAATGITTAIYSEVGRAWICILVDETLNVLKGGADNKALSRQRARGYHELSKALRSGDDHFQEALMGLTICGLSEFRFGTSHSRDMHVTAVDMFIRSKGGIKEALAAAPNVEPFYVSGQFGFGRCYFPSAEQLQSTIQRWKSDITSILSRPRPSCIATPTSSPVAPFIRRDYRTREARIIRLAIESTDTISPPTMFAASMQLSLFLELSWLILQFGSRFDMAINLFKRIEYLVKGSFDGGVPGNKAFELRAAAFATMVSRARRDVLGNYFPTQVAESDACITGIHTDAMKMFQYLEPEGRQFIINKLANWLSRKEFSTYQPEALESELAVLEDQITETWARLKP